jgi:hypothetical protein
MLQLQWSIRETAIFPSRHTIIGPSRILESRRQGQFRYPEHIKILSENPTSFCRGKMIILPIKKPIVFV